MFQSLWSFSTAADSLDSLPLMRGSEIAFAGRSNVGKSSLINALTGRKSLARTSHTPGRTQELVFFTNNSPLMLVDMPGYGYAEAPRHKIMEWTALIHAYLVGRANLLRVLVLIDARHGIKPTDIPVLETLDKAAVSWQVVLTKSDTLKSQELANRLREMKAYISKHPAAYPEVLAVSARTGAGIDALREALCGLVMERTG